MNAPEKNIAPVKFQTAPHFPIYMDYSATTPIDPRVADMMIPYLREQFGNPASRSHMYGWTAEKAVEEARGGGAVDAAGLWMSSIWPPPLAGRAGVGRRARTLVAWHERGAHPLPASP